MRMGFASFSFPRDTPIETVVNSVRKQGFQGLELNMWRGFQADIARLSHSDIGRIKRLCDEAGLEIPAIGCHEGYTSPNPAVRAEALQRTRRCIDAAAGVDVGIVITMSGSLQRGQSFEQAWSLMVPAVAEVVDYASEHGITIAFEPHVGLIVDSVDTMLRLLKEVPSRHLKMNFDGSQFAVRGWDVPALVRRTAEHIVYTHLKDTRGIVPNFEFLIPGEGDFDIKAFLVALRQVGYEGYVTTEISGMRSSKPGYDPQQALRLSYETVSRAFKEAMIELR
ncbi:MAG: sugar phosphate isomerase/epimerase [Candidatus Bathyarchaeia archaeon]